jgi:hypothetical protein
MKRILALLVMLASPALAQTPMTAAEFEAYVSGRTLTFGIGGEPYGIEQYRSNRRVTWSFIGGECQEGLWYEDDSNICFVYDFSPNPQCWQFFAETDGLRAVFMNEPGTTVLYEAQDANEPLICPGPDVGV